MSLALFNPSLETDGHNSLHIPSPYVTKPEVKQYIHMATKLMKILQINNFLKK